MTIFVDRRGNAHAHPIRVLGGAERMAVDTGDWRVEFDWPGLPVNDVVDWALRLRPLTNRVRIAA